MLEFKEWIRQYCDVDHDDQTQWFPIDSMQAAYEAGKRANSTDCKEDDLIQRLRIRASIRRNNTERNSVQEGKPDRISDLLEEAANEIEELEAVIIGLYDQVESLHSEIAGEDW